MGRGPGGPVPKYHRPLQLPPRLRLVPLARDQHLHLDLIKVFVDQSAGVMISPARARATVISKVERN